MPLAWLSLGSNVGDREDNLRHAVHRIRHLPRSRLEQVSSLYETPPWGDAAQQSFLNAVIALHTELEPGDLLRSLQEIERDLGRCRDPERPWGPRLIDLDVLLIDQQLVQEADLRIPHPYLHERAFVLVPLLELSPALVIPCRGPAVEWLAKLDREEIVAVASPGWEASV